MTAPLQEWPVEDVTAALRAGTAGEAEHRVAAVELLIEHDHWLRRSTFREACVQHHPADEDAGDEGDVLTIRWRDVETFLDDVPRASLSQLAVLRLALALGADEFGLRGLGSWHRVAAVRAFAAAADVDLSPGAPSLDEQANASRAASERFLATLTGGGETR